jgi:hypothetical protein
LASGFLLLTILAILSRVDRVSLARERVRMVKAELRSPAVELPCIKCRYYELVCTHPAVAEIKANPETGKVKMIPEFAKDARAEGGPCGPEGALFDPRSLPAQALVSMLSTGSGRWIAAIILFLICCALFR